MCEVPGKHRGSGPGRTDGPGNPEAAALFATCWKWPVLPGAGTRPARRAPRALRPAAHCACPDPLCARPGAHPFEPGVLAATTDPRMVAWWWRQRPEAPVLLATGEGGAPCALSVPAAAGPAALTALDRAGVRLGPVVAGPERWALLVAPYDLARLGALLYAMDSVPGTLRFHGSGGYLVLPPSRTGAGTTSWAREPLPEREDAAGAAPAGARPGAGGGTARPWLPEVETVLGPVVETLTRPWVNAPEF
ncbi:bifunctional DNA primase/polymerase [Streptomyces sp. NRRL F-5630]|uniref:bifunctional DNA primase/polymerase n=1 Tax=Streptomyces sp. NRRL F-5630 TaxID=1463864 RepID=UPI003D7530AB